MSSASCLSLGSPLVHPRRQGRHFSSSFTPQQVWPQGRVLSHTIPARSWHSGSIHTLPMASSPVLLVVPQKRQEPFPPPVYESERRKITNHQVRRKTEVTVQTRHNFARRDFFSRPNKTLLYIGFSWLRGGVRVHRAVFLAVRVTYYCLFL